MEPDALSGMPSLLLDALDCGWRTLRDESEAWLFREFYSRQWEGLSELYATLGGGAIDLMRIDDVLEEGVLLSQHYV